MGHCGPAAGSRSISDEGNLVNFPYNKRSMRSDLEETKVLDAINLKILREMQKDARQSFAELGRRVGLSLPAVAERVRKLEDAGIIRGYHAEVDATRLGYPMTAFIRLKTTPQSYARFQKAVTAIPEILECHHVTGEDSFTIKLAACSVAHLEELVGKLTGFGPTTTSLVLSTVLSRSLPIPGAGR